MNCSYLVRWMIVTCTYFLLKHGAKQFCLYIPTFCWQTKRHVASPPPPPPQRHNDVFWKKNSLETPPYHLQTCATLKMYAAFFIAWATFSFSAHKLAKYHFQFVSRLWRHSCNNCDCSACSSQPCSFLSVAH